MFVKAFGLLLWCQMAYDFNVGIKGAGTRGRHDGRGPGEGGGERRSKVKPTRRRNFKARGLITQKRGKNGEECDEQDVTRQTFQFSRCAIGHPFPLRGGPRVPGDVYQRVVHGPSACAVLSACWGAS